MQRPNTSLLKTVLLISSLILILSSLSFAVINGLFPINDEIFNGVKIGNVDVGGLTVDAAQTKISTFYTELIKEPVVIIKYKSKKWPIMAQDINYTFNNLTNLALKAQQIGRNGTIFQQFFQRYTASNKGYQIPISVDYNKDKLTTILNEISRELSTEPQNATLTLDRLSVKITPEIIGRKTDIITANKNIDQKLQIALFEEFTLPVIETPPAIIAKDFKRIALPIGSYTTQFDPSKVGRAQNVVLAAQALSHILIRPNEIFSFNKTVGLRIAEHGYQEAPVILNNKLIPGIGGGVCQVSTTLYNAVLLSNLKITDRTAHSLAPGYVPIGQDATVVDDLIDFKFINTSKNNIYLLSTVSDGQLTITILGPKPPINSPEVKILSVLNKIIEPKSILKPDPTLDLGKKIVEQEGIRGFDVHTYRLKEMNDKEISREQLAHDQYDSVDEIIKIGTKILDKISDTPKKQLKK